MIDTDLARLYGVETKYLNKTVHRNSNRFPEQFMFQLTDEEYESLRFQIGTSSSNHGGRRYPPYAFTEQGVAMLSAVLKSETAIQVSIQIMNAFVKMRHFLKENAEVFQKLETIDKRLLTHDQDINRLFSLIEQEHITPKKGIFFDGQIFDAYAFVSNIIKQAQQSILLIDNYIDETTLTLLTKRNPQTKATIYTNTITKQLELDLKKHNQQHPEITIQQLKKSHDRFLIIDNKTVYHFGASLKDLGKKWFAFSTFDKEATTIISKL